MNANNGPGYQHECLAVPVSGADLRKIDHARCSQGGTFAVGHARGVG